MRSYGHAGMNMLLSAPVVGGLLLAEQFIPAGVFLMLAVYWSSLADVDVHLDNYETFTVRSVRLTHTPYVLLVSLALRLNNVVARQTNSPRLQHVDRNGYTVTHRGITHTIWFACIVGVFATIAVVALAGAVAVGVRILEIEQNAAEVFELALEFGHPVVLLGSVFAAGFLAIIYHSLGDIVTPSGVGFVNPNDSVSLDRFRFDNEFANRSVLLFGTVAVIYSIFTPVLVLVGYLPLIYALAGLTSIYVVFLPIWLFIPRTRVGDWIVLIYDAVVR